MGLREFGVRPFDAGSSEQREEGTTGRQPRGGEAALLDNWDPHTLGNNPNVKNKKKKLQARIIPPVIQTQSALRGSFSQVSPVRKSDWHKIPTPLRFRGGKKMAITRTNFP